MSKMSKKGYTYRGELLDFLTSVLGEELVMEIGKHEDTLSVTNAFCERVANLKPEEKTQQEADRLVELYYSRIQHIVKLYRRLP